VRDGFKLAAQRRKHLTLIAKSNVMASGLFWREVADGVAKDFPGITGAINFSAGSHVPQKGVTIIAIKDGKFTLGAEVVPEKVPAP